MSGGVDLSLRVAVHPMACPAGVSATEAAALIELEVTGEAEPAPVEVAFVGAGRGAGLSTALTGLAAALQPGDRLLGPDGAALEPGGEGLSDLDERVSRPSLAAALQAGRAAWSAPAEAGGARRIFVFVQEALDEPVEELLSASAALADAGLGFDLFVAGLETDLGVLTRLAALGGGEAFGGLDAAAVAAAMAERAALLRRQRRPGVRLEMAFSAGVEVGRLFRVAPRPAFLGNVRLTPADRTLVLDPGPVAPGEAPSYLVTLGLPRRRAGNWRLVEARLGDRDAATPVWCRAPVVQRVTPEGESAIEVAADVIAVRDRAEAIGWLDDAVRGLAEGDHRRVAVTLERLQRRFVELGRSEAVDVAYDIRSRFLRSGVVDLLDLDRLRRFAAG